MCRRPLRSVSRTHSPARSGPRCTPDAGSGLAVVVGGRHAAQSRRDAGRASGPVGPPSGQPVAAKAGPRPRWSARRRRCRRARRGGTPWRATSCIARISCSPPMSAGRREAGVEGAGDGADRQPGAAVLRGGDDRGLVDQPTGRPSVSGGDDRAGLGLLGAADGLGERQVLRRPRAYGGPGRGPAAPGAGPGPSPRRSPARPPSRGTSRAAARRGSRCGPVRMPSHAMSSRARASMSSGDDPPGPAGDEGAAVRVAGELPDDRRGAPGRRRAACPGRG